MIYTIHFNQKDSDDKKWLKLLRDLECEYAFTGKEFILLEDAKIYAKQVIEVTGVNKLMIIENYDIVDDVDNMDYNPIIHYIGE